MSYDHGFSGILLFFNDFTNSRRKKWSASNIMSKVFAQTIMPKEENQYQEQRWTAQDMQTDCTSIIPEDEVHKTICMKAKILTVHHESMKVTVHEL